MTVKAKKAIIWSTVGTVGAAAVICPIILTSITSNFVPFSNERELKSKTMGPIIEEIVKGSQRKRKVNRQVYSNEYGDGTLEYKYGKYGFKYPAYNFRYDSSNTPNKPNAILDYVDSNGQQQSLNCKKAIHEQENFLYQSQTFQQAAPVETRWASEGFVWDQIRNGTLKKHPAILHMYRDMVSDDIPSVTKRFVIPSTIFGTNETGLYVAPGEIATITFSDEMYEWIQEHQEIPFGIKLNNNAWNGKAENVGTANEKFPMGGRYPFLRTDFGSWDNYRKSLPVDKNNPNKKVFPRTIQFGSPFGGIINIYTWKQMIKKLNGENKPIDFRFEISGAIPTMHYVDGVTTESEWYQMVDEVYAKKRAPFFTANTFFYSFGFPFDSTDSQPSKVLIAGRDLKSFTYPAKTFRKWFDFLFSSWYYASGERISHRKIDMQFSDAADIWGGAGAWGGGDALYAPVGWGIGAFLSDVEDWSWGNWGVYHEINHNFQQDGAFFKQHDHPETNEVTMAALAQLNDTLRARTEFDPLLGARDGWPALANHYGLIDTLTNKRWGGGEYALYENILYTFGPYNYMNYVRYDIQNHWNTMDGWTGQKEVINLCDYLKVNIADALYKYYEKGYWGDFGKDLKPATSDEITEIRRIREKYKRVDFVGNLYAAGAYIYDNEKNDFYYGGDSNPSFTIPFGEEYWFDMEKFTNSIEDIPWGGIEFPTYTASGAKLEADPENPYRIKYIPNLNGIKDRGLEDEFDFALNVREDFKNANNTVPQYKWKVKIRQEVNTPTIEYFEQFAHRSFQKSLELIESYDKNPLTSDLKLIKKVPYMNPSLKEFLHDNDNTKSEISRLKFKFVVPETRTYNLMFKCDDQLRIKIHNTNTNDKFEFIQPSWIGSFTYIKDKGANKEKDFNWQKGQVIDFDLTCVNTGGVGNYEIKFQKVDPSTKNKIDFNYYKHTLLSNIFDINNKYFGLKSVTEFLTNVQLAYKFRQLDYSRLPYITARFLNAGGYSPSYINYDNYDFYYKDPNSQKIWKENLIKNPNDIWEKWNIADKMATFYLELKEPEDVSGFIIRHRTSNHKGERPTYIKVTDLTDKDNPVVLYDGDYAKEFNDRSHDQSILNLEKTAVNAKYIKIEMTNTINAKAISLMQILPLNQKFLNLKLSNSFAYDNYKIQYSGRWEILENDMDGYRSNMNNGYIKSSPWTENEFRFNVFGNGFTVVGPKGPKHPATFDVYINDKLYKSNVSTYGVDFDPNANLFSIFTKTKQPESFKVRIVIKSGSLLFNYLNTYGDYSNLYIEKTSNNNK